MKVVLHIGAHRCATTSFQRYLRCNSERLADQGIGVWEPRQTRTGLFQDLFSAPRSPEEHERQQRAFERVGMTLELCAASMDMLVVSEENMMGTMRVNLRRCDLYAQVHERMLRYSRAFRGRVTDVMLNIRAQDSYWISALGYMVARGHAVPVDSDLDRVARDPRKWRDVITDVASVLPDARIWVLPYETYVGRPDAQLQVLTGGAVPTGHTRMRTNATPRLPELRDAAGAGLLPSGEGLWQPFTHEQIAGFRAAYAADLAWLEAGADGLARLPEDRTGGPEPAGYRQDERKIR